MASFKPQPIYSGDITAGTHWIVHCVGPRADLDTAEEKTKNELPFAVKRTPISRLSPKNSE
jgi:hypothetical protein